MLAPRFSRTLCCAIVLLCLSAAATSEIMLGLRPSVTVEPEYPKGVFDLNVLPLSLEFEGEGLAPNLRVDAILTLQLGGERPEIANLGLLLGLPWYPFSPSSGSRSGLFAGPKAGLAYNALGEFWATGASVEAGWSFSFGEWSLLACAEGGATVFLKSGEKARVGGHGGMSAIFGFRIE